MNIPQDDGWRVWQFDVVDPGGYETAAMLGLEPFAVSDGLIFWRKFVPRGKPETAE